MTIYDLTKPKPILEDPRRPIRMIPAPKNNLKILCDLYAPAPEYIGWSDNCASCLYWAGTKCRDVHAAIDANQKSHNAYSRMMSDNRSISM